MADDTVRVTTEPTEEKEEANAAIEELKADEEFMKKMWSQLKLESGKSVGSSSAATDMLSKGIGFDQKMSKAKLSGQQFEAGVSSTKEDDQNDDIYGVMCANLLNVIPCLRDMNHTIARIKAISMSEEKAMAVNAALELLKHEFGESKQGYKQDDTDDMIRTNTSLTSLQETTEEVNAVIQRIKADPDRVRSNSSQLKLEYGQSTSDKICDDRSIVKKKLSGSQPGVGRSTKQDSQNDDIDNEIRVNTSNLRRRLEDDDRTIKRIEAVQLSEEEAKKVNAALQPVKAGHSSLKKMLSKVELVFGKSAGSSLMADSATEDRIRAYRSAMKKKLSGSDFYLVGSSSAQDEPKDYIGLLSANISGLSRCLQDIDRTITGEEETEGVNATFKPSDAAEDVVKDKVLNLGASVGSSSIADNASITSKSAEQDEGINSKPVNSTDEPSTLKKTTLGDLLSEVGVILYEPKESKEGASGAETVDEASSIADNASITSKSAEQDEGINSKPVSSTDEPSTLKKTTLGDLLSEVGVILYEPKESKEGASGAETVDEDIE